MKICKILIIIGLVFYSSLVAAGTKEDIEKCAAIEGDASRLICYDNLAKSLGVDKPKSKLSTGNGKWKVLEKKSPIDDSTNVYISVESEDSVKSGYKTVRPTLYVRCAENKTNVFIIWDLYLGIEETRMLTRFDQQKATNRTWSISTDNTSVFVRGSDIEFARTLMKHDKLLTQIIPYGESPVMATFDIRGLSDAIVPLRKACHW